MPETCETTLSASFDAAILSIIPPILFIRMLKNSLVGMLSMVCVPVFLPSPYMPLPLEAEAASMRFMPRVTALVGSVSLTNSAIVLQYSCPSGTPISEISFPIEYITTDGWLRSLRIIASVSRCHHSRKVSPP